MTCLMEEKGGQVGDVLGRVSVAHIEKRRQLLKDMGVAEGEIERLCHSGRNGLTHYLKRNSFVSPMQTVGSQERSTSQVVIQPIMSSEEIQSSTQITRGLECNHMDMTSIAELLSTTITGLQAAQSAFTSDLKKPMQI